MQSLLAEAARPALINPAAMKERLSRNACIIRICIWNRRQNRQWENGFPKGIGGKVPLPDRNNRQAQGGMPDLI
ncbi:hypothetical protein NM680_10885 [Paracoccus sp. PS-1]|uniref:hypothetical protein n=1 Tax=unclassified Paracoccus (in: a-proteobacteria) TaxID=2688777 RepID=UPI0004BBFB15|nr:MULTISPECIES: hypothetical protein [unclassified Paracoccus (in: a-proteobacteria)]MDQ7262297.1 hypothetical protein [Paracoccus sp. PS1]UFM63623.1 hypothetical protein LOS78_05510 [Paracoccus sp. MA]